MCTKTVHCTKLTLSGLQCGQCCSITVWPVLQYYSLASIAVLQCGQYCSITVWPVLQYYSVASIAVLQFGQYCSITVWPVWQYYSVASIAVLQCGHFSIADGGGDSNTHLDSNILEAPTAKMFTSPSQEKCTK